MALRLQNGFAALVVLGAAALGQAPIVQPGAPGTNSKIVSPSSVAIRSRPPLQADTEFMQGMIHHHQQAVEMTAMMPTHTHNKALLKLGQRISISQTDEIQFMRNWLADRGKAVPMDHSRMDHSNMDHSNMDHINMDHGNMDHGSMDMASMPPMPGMLTAQQMKELAASSGSKFDYLFLTGMIQHHKGALTMVDDLFSSPATGQDNQLFDFATDVDNTQSAEIKIMQGMLKGKK